jgi:hypothetical protein
MRRFVSHRILTILLVLTRLVLGDVTHLPTAQAAAHEPTHSMMMAGEPCSGMAAPTNNGRCCKTSQCPCLHAPALVGVQPMPMMFSISYADVPATQVHRISGPPSVFFRPPIPTLH